MENIFLIETFPDGLNPIKAYLSDINADYSEFSSVNDAIKSGEVPGMVLLLADKKIENYIKDVEILRKNLSFAKIPRISLLPLQMSISSSSDNIIDGELEFHLPVEKSKFLSTVAKCLNIPPRRVFRIIITIEPEGSNLKYSGVSLDFSETGMGFECISDIPRGHKITVNFVNPRNRRRSVLRAEILRRASTLTGSTTFYGAKFIEMTDQDNKELMIFITEGN